MIKEPGMHFPNLLFITHPVSVFMMLILIPVGICAFPARSEAEPTDHPTGDQSLSSLVVHLEQSLRFDTPDGQMVVVSPGVYLIEPITQGKPRLAFWHEHGTVALPAARTEHSQQVETPEAYLIREDDNQDIHHVVVFLPDGTALEAIGSVSGIQIRGTSRVTRHYQLDRATGVVRFGDGQQGRRLPTGQSNISSQYRKGSGSQGDELSMIELQSLLSQPQQVDALTTKLFNSLREPFQLEEGMDRPGDDYARQMEDNPESCRAHCAGVEQCQAFTFVKPNPGSAQGQCFLKRSEPQPVANHCCVSGTRSSSQDMILRNTK